MTYAILCHPGHNRVYYGESKRFSVCEMTLAASKMSSGAGDIGFRRIAGIDYLTFEAQDDLPEADLCLIARLSFTFALFKLRNGVFEPAELPPYAFINPDISRMLKYTGKTNEVFTRLLINIAVFSTEFNPGGHIRLLDPIAGKGTTLFEGLVCGYDVCGIEIGDKVVAEAYHFLKRYLESERYKHQVHEEKISGSNKSFTAQRYRFEIARTKDAEKNKELREVELISGNSVHADKLYKKNTFHVIVGDLPYGVQHGSVTNEKQSSLTRNPKELLASCLPAWKAVLMPGGILALSWNTLVLNVREMTKILEDSGLAVLRGDAYSYGHRVDQAINRDIIVAKRL